MTDLPQEQWHDLDKMSLMCYWYSEVFLLYRFKVNRDKYIKAKQQIGSELYRSVTYVMHFLQLNEV